MWFWEAYDVIFLVQAQTTISWIPITEICSFKDQSYYFYSLPSFFSFLFFFAIPDILRNFSSIRISFISKRNIMIIITRLPRSFSWSYVYLFLSSVTSNFNLADRVFMSTFFVIDTHFLCHLIIGLSNYIVVLLGFFRFFFSNFGVMA